MAAAKVVISDSSLQPERDIEMLDPGMIAGVIIGREAERRNAVGIGDVAVETSGKGTRSAALSQRLARGLRRAADRLEPMGACQPA